MKILIIQLARLGDIYLTWPAIRAMKRKHPQAEIHVLSRPRFQMAYQGLGEVTKMHELPSKDILGPILGEQFNLPESVTALDKSLATLKSEGFDRIYNFSYSPLSSYLTHELTTEKTEVFGFTRFSDGFLSIPDDTSAYFSAQVGIEGPNRIHLADLFALTMDLDLEASDWRSPEALPAFTDAGTDYICLHIGASQNGKRYPARQWLKLSRALAESYSGNIVIIGAKEDTTLAEALCLQSKKIRQLCGHTSLLESMAVLADAKLLIGADSAPIHMASLVQTPCLNISSPKVNFWETGPRSAGSVVVRHKNNLTPDPEEICDLAIAMMNSSANLSDFVSEEIILAQAINEVPSYRVDTQDESFEWSLTRAIYLGELFPEATDPGFIEGLQQISEANKLICEQIKRLKKIGKDSTVLGILSSGEEVISAISKIVPSVGPIVRWYQTEKLRLGPGSFDQLLEQTELIQNNLERIIALYLQQDAYGDKEATSQEGTSEADIF